MTPPPTAKWEDLVQIHVKDWADEVEEEKLGRRTYSDHKLSIPSPAPFKDTDRTQRATGSK